MHREPLRALSRALVPGGDSPRIQGWRTLVPVSKTERALEVDTDHDDALENDTVEDVSDSTADLMAEVDEALEEYVAAVEEYTAPDGVPTTDPFAEPPEGTPTNGVVVERKQVPTADGSDDAFFVLPEIIAADDEVAVADLAAEKTSRFGVGMTEVVAREGVDDDILEELRRAEIDGPVVEVAPHDDTSAARRRPRRNQNYDPAPIPIPAKPPRLLGRKPRVRRVTRVVRHVDPWSVFKISIVASMVLYIILLTAGVLLWNVANATGTVDNVERFFESFGWSNFDFNGGQIYHSAWIAGLFAMLGLTGLAVLLATLFNLITDLVGGMRFTVLEEEVVERRTSPMRRFVVRRPEPEIPATMTDESGTIIREAVVDDSGAFDRPAR